MGDKSPSRKRKLKFNRKREQKSIQKLEKVNWLKKKKSFLRPRFNIKLKRVGYSYKFYSLLTLTEF